MPAPCRIFKIRRRYRRFGKLEKLCHQCLQRRTENLARRHFMRARLRAVIFAMAVIPLALWGTDRQAGTWKMNMEKSKFASDMPSPKGETGVIKDKRGAKKFFT